MFIITPLLGVLAGVGVSVIASMRMGEATRRIGELDRDHAELLREPQKRTLSDQGARRLDEVRRRSRALTSCQRRSRSALVLGLGSILVGGVAEIGALTGHAQPVVRSLEILALMSVVGATLVLILDVVLVSPAWGPAVSTTGGSRLRRTP